VVREGALAWKKTIIWGRHNIKIATSAWKEGGGYSGCRLSNAETLNNKYKLRETSFPNQEKGRSSEERSVAANRKKGQKKNTPFN